MKKAKEQDEYYFFKEFYFDNCRARVYKPILTEEEHTRRMAAIEKAPADLLKEQYLVSTKSTSEYISSSFSSFQIIESDV